MILYHYTSGKGVFEIMNSKQFLCSNVKFLNDPTEQSYFDDVLNIVLNECPDCKEIYSELYDKYYCDVVFNSTDKFIASFSKNQDSLSMWNYYAKGNGYNIGFDIDSIIERNNSGKIYLRKVEMIYDEIVQQQKIRDHILGSKKEYKKYLDISEKITKTNENQDYLALEGERNEIEMSFNDGVFELMLSFKHQAYKGEEEVRLIITEDLVDKISSNFKVSEYGIFIEYIPLNLDLNEDIKSVTIHPLNGDLHFQGTTKFLASKVGYGKIKILLSNIPFRLI